jgi:hypothetical protein
MYIQAVVTRNGQMLMERNYYKRAGVTRGTVIARLESYIIREMLNYVGECWIAAREVEGPMPKSPGRRTGARVQSSSNGVGQGPQTASSEPPCTCLGCQMLDAVRRAEG